MTRLSSVIRVLRWRRWTRRSGLASRSRGPLNSVIRPPLRSRLRPPSLRTSPWLPGPSARNRTSTTCRAFSVSRSRSCRRCRTFRRCTARGGRSRGRRRIAHHSIPDRVVVLKQRPVQFPARPLRSVRWVSGCAHAAGLDIRSSDMGQPCRRTSAARKAGAPSRPVGGSSRWLRGMIETSWMRQSRSRRSRSVASILPGLRCPSCGTT